MSYDVARPWHNASTLLRAARKQEMFLKILRNIFCVQDTKFGVRHKCCARGKTSQHLGNTITSAMLLPQCVLVLLPPYLRAALIQNPINFSLKNWFMLYRSIRNSHIPPPPPGIPRAFDALPCPGRGEFDGPQRTWGGAFDHNTRGVGHLIRRLDFMFRAALRIQTARICLQMLKQLQYPSVIIGEPIFNVADITILFVTSGKTMETDISAQIISDFRRKSEPEVGHLTTEFNLDVGHLNGFLAPRWGI